MGNRDNLRLDERFTYHPPKGDQAQRYEEVRAAGLRFADLLVVLAHSSPELEQAIDHVDQAAMWANAAIARTES